jgi:branched-chain amino acid transport system substrate-binding protein
MKKGKLFQVGIIVLTVTVLLASVLSGCKSSGTTTSETKTLDIGMVASLSWPVAIDMVHSTQAAVDMVNNAGGITIGGDKYKVNLIVEDAKMDVASAKTAAEKLIYQNKVKFILGDQWGDGYLDVVETNKVVAIMHPPSKAIYDPKYNYSFQGACMDTSWVTLMSWLAENRSTLKTFVGAYPDLETGHENAAMFEKAAKAVGLTVTEQIFYPITATDLSSVGTKVKSLNPDMFLALGGGPPFDSLAFKAVYQAGYKGQMIAPSTNPGGVMMAMTTAETIEGLIGVAWPVEFDTPDTQLAKDFKAAYITKFGKWDSPEIVGVNNFYILKAALEKAKSIDPVKVAAVINNGLTYDSPCGAGVMVSRTDLNNSRTVDTINALPVKQIKAGKIVQIDTITKQEVLDFCKKVYGWK